MKRKQGTCAQVMTPPELVGICEQEVLCCEKETVGLMLCTLSVLNFVLTKCGAHILVIPSVFK